MTDVRRPVYLGVDIGTSGCRAVAIDDTDTLVAEAAVELPAARRTADGRVEQEPEDWWRALTRLTNVLIERLPAGARSAALAVDGTSGSVLLIDSAGRALTPGVMYDDRRGRPYLIRVAELAPVDAAVHGTGASLPKVLALLSGGTRPAGRRALHQSEWLTARLLDDFRRGDENNCLKLGYDPRDRCWPGWLLDLLPAGLLPEVVPAGTPLGQLSRTAADETGLPPDLAVIAGTTDSVAAALAAGATEIGDAVTSLGSTLVLKLVSAHPLFAAVNGVYSHRVFDAWLVGGASNSGGRVLRRFFSDRQLRELTPQLTPERSTGLDYYPLLEPGERFPVNDPELEPRIRPIPDRPTELLQGLLEGMARIEAAGYRRLAELGAGTPRRIFTSGGGAQNRAWRQIRERLLEKPIRTARHTQPAVGAALIARQGHSSSLMN